MTSDPKAICVVDDNVDAADSLCQLLETCGYSVHAAYDGISGLAAIFRVRPFLAILDIGMPGLTGYDVAQQVRASFGASLKIVAVSGWGTRADVERAIASGFDIHMTKPAAPAQLMAVVDAYYAETQGVEEDEARASPANKG